MICVDSVFCVKTRAEQIELFNKIQDFQIEANIKELFNLSNRTTYTGNFEFHTRGILYRPNHDEMDRGEWV